MPDARTLAVRKEITVDAPLETAFRVFTQEIGSWWPLPTHSVFADRARSVEMEPRAGGQIVETSEAGEQSVWGTLTAWEPPHRVSFSWHPGRGPETAQEVEVTFAARGDGTLVRLVHTGWEKLGDAAEEQVRSYDGGWDHVLTRFVEGLQR